VVLHSLIAILPLCQWLLAPRIERSHGGGGSEWKLAVHPAWYIRCHHPATMETSQILTRPLPTLTAPLTSTIMSWPLAIANATLAMAVTTAAQPLGTVLVLRHQKALICSGSMELILCSTTRSTGAATFVSI